MISSVRRTSGGTIKKNQVQNGKGQTRVEGFCIAQRINCSGKVVNKNYRAGGRVRILAPGELEMN
jgi:hypothetical protein